MGIEIHDIATAIALADKIDALVHRRDKVKPSGLFDHQDPDAEIARIEDEISAAVDKISKIAASAAANFQRVGYRCDCCIGVADTTGHGKILTEVIMPKICNTQLRLGGKHSITVSGKPYGLTASRALLATIDHCYNRCNRISGFACNVTSLA
jgi:hypothetical protein